MLCITVRGSPLTLIKSQTTALMELGSILTTTMQTNFQNANLARHLGVANSIRCNVCVWFWLSNRTAIPVREEFAAFWTCFEAFWTAWGSRLLSSFHSGGFHNNANKCPKLGEETALSSLQGYRWVKRSTKGVQLSNPSVTANGNSWGMMAAKACWLRGIRVPSHVLKQNLFHGPSRAVCGCVPPIECIAIHVCETHLALHFSLR